MISKPQNATAEFFVNFVRDWFKGIASGAWQEAFTRIDLAPNFGEPYSPQRFRHEVENDHFCDGTVFRKRHPEGIAYSDPNTIGESQYVELYPLRGEHEWVSDDLEDEVARCLREGWSIEVEHPIPLNGEWSDLTACFQFVDQGDNYAVRLDWLHVL